jgi:hypothetical protein
MTLSTYLRPAAILALALSLAACGGKASFPINGTVAGLTYGGLVITTNGMDLAIPANATAFSFPNSLSYGDVYDITVKTPAAHEDCTTIDPLTGRNTGADTAGRFTTIAVTLTCVIQQHSIGGAVTGLTTDGLVLTNGSAGGTVPIAAAATSYAFPALVPYNVSYGVTVYTQPKDAVCTVANSSGVMGDANVTNIDVTCKSTL